MRMTRPRWALLIGLIVVALVAARIVWRQAERAPKMCVTTPC